MHYLRERDLDDVDQKPDAAGFGHLSRHAAFCSHSEENDTGVWAYSRTKYDALLRRPEGSAMGWNTITDLKQPLFSNLPDESYVYFVHGYFVERSDEAAAICAYGVDFAAAIQHKNFYAVQFHPEKSGPSGEQILENFLKL